MRKKPWEDQDSKRDPSSLGGVDEKLISADMATKPFKPEEVQRILQFLHSPAVFLNMADDWPGRNWTLEHLALCLKDKTVCFRLGKRCRQKAPLFETECSYIEGTLAEFLAWTRGNSDSASVGLFSDYPLSEYWAYADYKYIALLFQDQPTMFKDVLWTDFGFPGRDAQQSTLWIGTNGANTPCHQDSYGYNLVFQIQGRKRWHLFPPEDAECLYPTRIPYEESSVFSQVNVVRPNLYKFPAFQQSRAHRITLQPGQVLFVPRHWWHYVESVDPVTVSVNSWLEMEKDDEARIGEALTRTIICALKTTPSLDNKDNWLNPTEDGITSHDENMQYLNLAAKAYLDKRREHNKEGLRCTDRPSPSGLKRDSRGQLKMPFNESVNSFTIPFGPQLIPVTCDAETSHKHTMTSPEENVLSPNGTNSVLTDPHTQTVKVSEGPEGRRDDAHCGRISTNDVLDCLLHPDVVALVTKLMMDRQTELDSRQITQN